MRQRRPSRTLLFMTLLLIVLLLASCGRDVESPIASAQESPSQSAPLTPVPGRYLSESKNPPPRSTPPELLRSYFEQVYARRDSVLYAAMLDRKFQFVFLPEDADSLRDILGADDFWKKRLDLQSTGAMFRDPSVTFIRVDILVSANSQYLGDDCDDCRDLSTTITLRLLLDDGSGEPLYLAVDSPQTFIVRPDPIQTGKWVLFRQIDRPTSAGMTQAGDAQAPNVESLTLGQIKGYFFPR